jgi:hypothetical protein
VRPLSDAISSNDSKTENCLHEDRVCIAIQYFVIALTQVARGSRRDL